MEQSWYILVLIWQIYFHSWCRQLSLNVDILNYWKLVISVSVHKKPINEMYIAWPLCYGLYGPYGPRCPLSPKRPLNFITHSLHGTCTQFHGITKWNFPQNWKLISCPLLWIFTLNNIQKFQWNSQEVHFIDFYWNFSRMSLRVFHALSSVLWCYLKQQIKYLVWNKYFIKYNTNACHKTTSSQTMIIIFVR